MNQLAPVSPSGERLPARDYTAALLRRAAADGSVSAERLESVRTALHKAAAGNAAAFTKGRSSTVTRAQAEGFYRAVFYQLDAALLPMQSDAAALEALRSADIGTLLGTGQQHILAAYEQAKSAFRRAYRLTQPFETVFFRGLLDSFAAFCTQYDARFRADAVTLDEEYPLLGGRRVPLGGVLGAHFYYTALLHEGELLACFPAEEIRTMLRQYAARYRTTPDNVAENLADLVLRQWLAGALCGRTGLSMYLPEHAADILTERRQLRSADALCEEMRALLFGSPLAEPEGAAEYAAAALPQIAAGLYRHLTGGTAAAWIPASGMSTESVEKVSPTDP